MQVPKILAFPFFTSLLLLLNFCDGSASVISFKSIFIILDVEFGRLQARDMLQHLWTGPISNASVDVVQGSRSVEVRAVGVTKVLCILIGSKVLMFQMLNVPKVHNFFFLSSNLPVYVQGAAIDRILGEIVHNKGMKAPIDYVLCIGHFISKVFFMFCFCSLIFIF